MSTVAISVRASADKLAHVLSYSASITPNLHYADHFDTAAVMYILIGKGVNRLDEIVAYLRGHDSVFGADTVQFLLDTYDGGDRRHCLWRRDQTGRYELLKERLDS